MRCIVLRMETSLVAGLVAARSAQTQLALAARLMRMDAGMERAVADLVEAAQQNAEKLAQAASGIGRALDVTV